jgi:hypothetical protein
MAEKARQMATILARRARIMWSIRWMFLDNTGGNGGMFCQIVGRYGAESAVTHD